MVETWLRHSRVRLPALVMVETWLRHSRVRLPALVMLETWLRESGVPRLRNFFLLGSGNLYRIITLSFSTLATPWSYLGQVHHQPVMLET